MKKKNQKCQVVIGVIAIIVLASAGIFYSQRQKEVISEPVREQEGELLEYTGILSGWSQINDWEVTGKALDVTGQGVAWEKGNPNRIPIALESESYTDDIGKIARVWGRKAYYTPKEGEFKPDNAPYLKVERYEVLADFSFVDAKLETYREILPCSRLWNGGVSKWLVTENDDIQVEAILRYSYEPEKAISLWYDGNTGELLRIEGEENKEIECNLIELTGKLNVVADANGEEQWILTLSEADQIEKWGEKIAVEYSFLRSDMHDDRMVVVWVNKEDLSEEPNSQGMRVFELNGFKFYKP